jgi:hypothetical protein
MLPDACQKNNVKPLSYWLERFSAERFRARARPTISPGGPPSNNNAEERQPERHYLGSVHGRISTLAEDLSSDHGLPKATSIGFPLVGQIYNLAPFRKRGQAIESVGEHPFMLLGSPRAAERATHGMVDKDGSGWRDASHDVTDRTDNQRRDALSLDTVGHETNGLMTVGSIGDQDGQVHASLGELTR